jgi:uncharacterized membrane protein YfcA
MGFRVSVSLLASLTLLGFAGALIAGLLGVGGAILMIPLLLYTPPWLGFPPLDVRAVAGISMVQVFFAALSGAIAHGRRGAVHRGLTVTVGVMAALGSLVGGVASRWLHPLALLIIFAVMASLGAVLMWTAPIERGGQPGTADTLSFRRSLEILVGGGVGLGAGLVGAGGAFLLVPLLITVVGVPTRIAIGSSLAITLWTATAGVIGKLATAQIPFAPAAALVLGAIPGAQVGERVSRRFGVRGLKGLLAAVMTLVALIVWADVFSRIR